MSVWDQSRTRKNFEFHLVLNRQAALTFDLPGTITYLRTGGGTEKERNVQLRLWNFSNSPVAPGQLSCQISANQREVETSANINKHWKARAMGNDIITNVISANQHFASTFSMQIFKFQRRSCKLSFLFPPRRQSAQERCSQARDAIHISILTTHNQDERFIRVLNFH